MSYRNFLKSETIVPHRHLGFKALAYPDKHEQNILRVSEVYIEEHVIIIPTFKGPFTYSRAFTSLILFPFLSGPVGWVQAPSFGRSN